MRTKITLALTLVLCMAGSVSRSFGTALTQAAAPEAAPTPFTILISNDDGYDAPGIKALEAAFEPLGEVYVAAPATDQSGKGHSIVISRDPIFVQAHEQPSNRTWYAIEGPPATCVRLALEALVPRRPDIVISGINRGTNMGFSDMYLSGTVGAAREGAIAGIPAIAVSMGGNQDADYAAAAAYVRQLVQELRSKNMLKPGLFLSINRPPGETKGVKVTRLSFARNHEDFDRRMSPHGRVYFWSRYRPPDDGEEGTDRWAFKRGYITLTPLRLDTTDDADMGQFKSFEGQSAAAAAH